MMLERHGVRSTLLAKENVVLFLAVIGIILTFLHGVNSVPVNVALNKPIRALYTCGTFGTETYFNHADLLKKNEDRNLMSCSDPSVHPPAAMVDGNLDTKWQSANVYAFITQGDFSNPDFQALTSHLHAVINLDLRQSFIVEKITLQLGDAKRPRFIVVKKANSLDRGYDAWAYKVNADSDCKSVFNVTANNDPKELGNAVCSTYTKNSTTFETIEFDFTAISSYMREWQRARYIVIEFYEIERTLTLGSISFHHFAVSELVVMAECVCNGHATGCELNPDSGIYECICGGNTVGLFCERCMPLFNQKAWQYEIPCEECNCFNHATECTYDAKVENQSLNKAGLKSGGGQCLNCQNNTAGVNCEKCKPNYYRPVTVTQSDPSACVLCECNIAGSTINPSTGIVGDCVMNNDGVLPPGMQPGHCFCKTNVKGLKCDACKEGFYDLSESNPDGCQPCACNASGTVGGSQTCNQTGQCSCKSNVEGRACDVCKDGYYGMTVGDPNGCKPCDCDRGGASSATCTKTNGQCDCQPNIQDRRCNSTVPGFYFSDFHFIHLDFETTDGVNVTTLQPGFLGNGYVKLEYGEEITSPLNFPDGTTLSGTCALLIRYSAPEAVLVSLQIRTSDDPRLSTFQFPACGDKWCYLNTVTMKNFTLMGTSPHFCKVIPMSTLLLDRMICLPVEFLEPQTSSLLGSNDFSSNCDVINNDMRNGTALESLCETGWLSLMSYYQSGPRSCDCSLLGSSSAVCDPHGGQCLCKSGVTGRRCDQCDEGFYQLTNTGCTNCSCQTTSGQCNPLTGQCVCPPHTIGLHCDQCDFNTWEWDATAGCKECNCNKTGSENTWCNRSTGVCTCKIGVQGEKCDQCADTYKNLNILGCSRCGCDSIGSSSDVCDNSTGQCPCKENVGGLQCNQCKPGSFHLHADHPKGCLDCICMGVASECLSSTDRQQQKSVVLIESKEGGLSGTVGIVDGNGVDLTSPAVEVPPTSNGIATQSSVSVTVGPAGNIYWKIPEMVGDLLPVYGGSIKADVHYQGITSPGTASVTRAILIGRNDIRLVQDVPEFGENVTTSITIVLKESSWKKEAGLSPVTRGEFLLALSDVKVIMMPAAFTNTDHASFLSHLEYSIRSFGGVLSASVETCQCGPAYTGLSCQSCAVGYKRTNVTNHAYLGVCVPCECNNHASRCDPDTGVCIDCLHNTAGPRCEFCAPGYYGDATSGLPTACTQCPCYEPRVANATCSRENSTLKCDFCNPGYTGDFCDSCLPFHFGNPANLGVGTCTPCDCNGKTDQCDPVTGQCLNCQGNTIGNNCERCIDGFYNNNLTNQCEVCNCTLSGSTSTVCDPVTGECPCYDGIGGRTCDSCLENYWGYADSTPGCVPCSCTEAGSQTLQCNSADGVCGCLPNVATVSGKCDECVGGYYGLPAQSCQVCDCDGVGTDPAGGACDLVTGQCPCKPGVTGRRCDRCKTLYTDLGPDGCKECGACQSSLGNDSKKLQENGTEAYNVSKEVEGIQAQDRQLQVVSTNLEETMTKLGLTGTDISSVNKLTDNITLQETAIKTQVDTLRTKVLLLKGISDTQKTNTYTLDERLKFLLADSYNILDSARTETQNGLNYQYRLEQFNVSAQQYMGQGATNGSGAGLDFTTQLSKVNADHQTILSDQSVQDMQQKTDQQASDIESLLTEEATVRREYTTQSADMTNMDNNLSILKTLEEEIKQQQAEAKTAKEEAEVNLKAIESATEAIRNMTSSADSSRQLASQSHDECRAIMSGDASTVLTNITLLAGVTNWNSGYSTLQQLQTNVSSKVAVTDDSVKDTELHVQNLVTQAGVLNTTFHTVKPRGDSAVLAIANFEQVIQSLNNSLTTADEAKKTIADAQRALAAVTVPALENRASASRLQSEQLLAVIDGISYEPDVLNKRLESSIQGLTTARAQWPPIDVRLVQLQQEAESLNSQTGASGVSSIVTEATNITNQAKASAAATLDALKTQNATLTGEKAEVDTVKSQLERAVNLTTTVEQEARSLTSKVDNLKRSIESITQQKDYVDSKQKALNDTVTRIERKLLEAQELLGKLRQPVHFNGTSGVFVPSPSASLSLPYTDVQFKFKKDISVTNALLFFTENSDLGSRENFSVEVVDNHVQMEFFNNGPAVRISSQAALCDNCWFQVQASKYDATGQLTVTLLSTGGIATATGTGTSPSSLTLNSPLYYGSLPSSIITSKVITGFKGCMQDTRFNGADIDIWKNSIVSENIPTCCRKPVVQSPSLDPGVSFSGFGKLVLSPRSLDISLSPLTLQLKFRTYNPNAYLLLVASDSVTVKLSLHLNNGYIVFEYGSVSGVENRVQTSKQYNTGEWFVVTAGKDTQNSLIVSKESDPNDRESVTPITANAVDLTQLRGLDFTIGSDQSPNSVNPATDSRRFSGCMKEFSYQIGSDPSSSLPLTSGVSTAGCPAKIIPGVSFVSPYSFMRLSFTTVTTINTVSMNVVTTIANGILVYIQVTPSMVFYLALFNGNLVLEYRIPSPFRLATRGVYISDGVQHSLKVNLLSSPVLTVDDKTFGNTIPPSPFTKSGSTPVYIGGFSNNTNLGATYPVRSSFVGGISNFQINDKAIDVFLEDPMTAQNSDLSGIPQPPVSPPPIPYTTPVPPTTPTPPTCGVIPNLSAETNGLWFTGNSYWEMTLNETQRALFENSFYLAVDFAAFGPDGLLFLAADHATTPIEYLLIYLKDGIIFFEIKGPAFNETIQSLKAYNNGIKYSVDFLVFGTHIMLTEHTRKDFAQGVKGNSGVPFFSKINQLLLGGTARPETRQDFLRHLPPLPDFQGAIYKWTVHRRINNIAKTDQYMLKKDDGLVKTDNTQSVPSPVGYGVSLNGLSSYINIAAITRVSGTLLVSLTVTNVNPSAMLFYIYGAPTLFIALDTLDYRLRVTIQSSSSSFVKVSDDTTNFCDGLSHTYLLDVSATAVTLRVDNNPPETFTGGFQVPAINNGITVVGGLHDQALAFSSPVSRTSLQGCVARLSIDGTVVEPSRYLSLSRGAALACPL